MQRLIERSEVNVLGIPGTNRWFPSQGQARIAALQAARLLGLGYRIVHDPRPRRGLPHYHLAYADGRPLERTHADYSHFFYGRRPPRRIFRGRPWREAEASGQPLLQFGARGTEVRELQRRLNQWLTRMGRPSLVVDGIFGARVESVVYAFQRANGLTADGIAGPQTQQALMVAVAGSSSSSPHTVPSKTTSSWVLPANIQAAGERQYVRYDSPPAWDGGRNCTGIFTRGAAQLRSYILASFPGVRSIGGYSCRQNTANPAQTSVHGTGRALDIMIPPVNNRANSAIGDPIANWLVQNAAAIGVQYIIWNRVQWSGSRSGRKDRPYRGPNPHTDHIHVELNRDGAARLTLWFLNQVK